MATEIWWIDPPKSALLGGYLTFKEHDNVVDTVNSTNNNLFVGFQCVKQWSFPLDLISDHYECWSYHSFMKFRVPTTASGTMTSAELYIMVGGAELILNVLPVYMDIDVWYKNVYAATEYPWHILESHDYPTGTWQKNASSFEDFYEMWGDFLVYGPHWLDPCDVTAAVQQAIDEGWTWVGIMLTPNYRAPLDWDYDERPTAYDQQVMLAFYGAVTPYWVNAPTGFPNAYCAPTPWLKITYEGGQTQYVPGEDVTTSGDIGYLPSDDDPAWSGGTGISSISADSKARMAIAGTYGGGLWVCWSGGGVWNKAYELEEPITAVRLDIIRNFQDFPNDATAWFGTYNGHLYKSEDSLGTWTLITQAFLKPIWEIRVSETDSNKIAVGVDDGIWVSTNGGDSWTEVLEAPTEL